MAADSERVAAAPQLLWALGARLNGDVELHVYPAPTDLHEALGANASLALCGAGWAPLEELVSSGNADVAAFAGRQACADCAREAEGVAAGADMKTVFRAALNRYRAQILDQPSFTCPECGLVSYHPKDLEEGYCARCRKWTGVAKVAEDSR